MELKYSLKNNIAYKVVSLITTMYSYMLTAKQVENPPLNEEERRIYDEFIGKYDALVTVNERKRRVTFHLHSKRPLKKADLESELSGVSGLKVVGFI